MWVVTRHGDHAARASCYASNGTYTSGAPSGRSKLRLGGVARAMRVGGDPRRRSSTLLLEMSNPHPQPSGDGSLELPVDVLLANARPFPSHAEMVIEDLTPDEGAEFLAALQA